MDTKTARNAGSALLVQPLTYAATQIRQNPTIAMRAKTPSTVKCRRSGNSTFLEVPSTVPEGWSFASDKFMFLSLNHQ
jgi:hypothetical protein